MWPIGIGIYNEWWRLLTGAFLHGSFLHIAFNMYVLFALGPTLERVLGHGRYLLLYIVAALGAVSRHMRSVTSRPCRSGQVVRSSVSWVHLLLPGAACAMTSSRSSSCW